MAIVWIILKSGVRMGPFRCESFSAKIVPEGRGTMMWTRAPNKKYPRCLHDLDINDVSAVEYEQED